MSTVDDLDAFFGRFGYTGRHDRDDAELAAVRRLRPRLRALLTAERDEAVEIVNDLLAEARGAAAAGAPRPASTGTCTPSTPTPRSTNASPSRPRWR